jgi:hypothetical protein
MKNFSTIPGIGTPSTNRPYGPFGDDATPGDGTGTAVRTDWVGDIAYAWIKLMNDSGLVPDDSAEGVTTGQALLAVQNMINKGISLNPFKNLRVYPAAAHPTYQCTITYDELYIGWKLATSGSHTVDIQVNGAGGLDTGSEANVWYYIYMIMKQDGTLNTLLSASPTSPTLPSGYIYSRLIGAVHNTGGNFVAFQQKNRSVSINAILGYNGTPGSSFIAVDISAIIPTLIVNTFGGYLTNSSSQTTALSVDGALSAYSTFSSAGSIHAPFSGFPLIGSSTYILGISGSTAMINISTWELSI